MSDRDVYLVVKRAILMVLGALDRKYSVGGEDRRPA